MKALSVVFGFVLIGSQAFASKSVYSSRSVILVGQSKSGLVCPQVLNVTAINQAGSLEGETATVILTNGQRTTYSYQYSSRSCISDMICLTENYYTTKGVMNDVSLRRNNDGAYPTTDLPGYSAMTIVQNRGGEQEVYCTYMLE